jgi:hypothetical protein
MRYRGFNLMGGAGDWTAISTDCEGYGPTKDAAVEDALRDRRGQADDADTLDAEEGIIRDEFGFVADGEACDCRDGVNADDYGRCRVCGGQD